MAVRMLRISSVFTCFIVILSLSPQLVLADGKTKFFLGGEASSAIALVKDKTLTLILSTGPATGYKKPKGFDLAIGGYVLNLKTFVVAGDDFVRIDFKVNGKNVFTANGPKSIVVQTDKIIVEDKDQNKQYGPFKTNFGKKKDGVYQIKVELTGNVPKTFNLISDALMKKSEAESAGILPPLWAIIAISVGGVVLLVILAIIAGFIFYCQRKKKALKQSQKVQDRSKNLGTASVDAANAKTPEPTSNPAPVEAEKEKNKQVSKKGRKKESSGDKSKTKKSGKETTKGEKKSKQRGGTLSKKRGDTMSKKRGDTKSSKDKSRRKKTKAKNDADEKLDETKPKEIKVKLIEEKWGPESEKLPIHFPGYGDDIY